MQNIIIKRHADGTEFYDTTALEIARKCFEMHKSCQDGDGFEVRIVKHNVRASFVSELLELGGKKHNTCNGFCVLFKTAWHPIPNEATPFYKCLPKVETTDYAGFFFDGARVEFWRKAHHPAATRDNPGPA